MSEINVYEVCEDEWYAASSADEAFDRCLCDWAGIPMGTVAKDPFAADEAIKDYSLFVPPRLVPRERLTSLTFKDEETDTEISFADVLDRMIQRGEHFPVGFATGNGYY